MSGAAMIFRGKVGFQTQVQGIDVAFKPLRPTLIVFLIFKHNGNLKGNWLISGSYT